MIQFPPPGSKIVLLEGFISSLDGWDHEDLELAAGAILTVLEDGNDPDCWLAEDEHRNKWLFALDEFRILSPLEQLAMEAG